MANRQIYGLTARTLALTDVIPTQDAAGSAEAGKNTITDIKTLLRTPIYKVYAAIVTNSALSFTVVVRQNDFTGVTFAFTELSTGILAVTATGGTPFTAAKTAMLGGSMVNASGVPQHFVGAYSSTTEFQIGIWKYDGTQASTPNFNTTLFEIRVYD